MLKQDRDEEGGQTSATLQPFDWTDAGHVLVKASESVDWKMEDVEAFAKRVQSIEYGLSAETEFAAILSWLGRCVLVHKLDQDGYSSQRDRSLRVPDLLTLVEHRGHRVPILIEVKTTEKERLVLKTEYLECQKRYARELQLPLLIAWKPRRLGFWLLVDPILAKVRGDKSILSLNDAATNNLLGPVAGDFVVIPQSNAGIVFEAKIVKKTRIAGDEFEGIAQISHVGFQNAMGEQAVNIPRGIMAMMFSSMEETNDVTDKIVRKSFLTTGRMLHAQQILRTAVAFRAKADQPIKWRHVGKDLESYLSRDELDDAIGKNIGTFVKYQLFQHPQEWPKFLPSIWNSLDSGTPLESTAVV